jgi:uncharacterized zinc-type alcohol dehydrogenase-like protein
MNTTQAYAATSPTSGLSPFALARREPRPKDVELEVLFCGICHTDIHQVRNEWGGSVYPVVPGHEIVGRVIRAGRAVRKFKLGDVAGIGCMVDSCRKCDACKKGLEQHCENATTFTYNSLERDGKTRTYGGYSKRVLVDEAFALKIAAKQPLERVAPLLCAGITTYSPLKRHGIGRGDRVGVMGLGGLGHMGVKLAAAMGAEVTVLSRSASKKADAKRLGAHAFALTSDTAAAAKLANRFDLILDTVSADHDVDAALGWTKVGGTLVLVGAPPNPMKVGAFSVIPRKRLEGSLIGGIKETQEMLDFCARKKVYSDVEVVAMKDVDAAYERMLRGDVRYRFVIDLKTL